MITGLPKNFPIFPHPNLAIEDGLLAYGSDLSSSTLRLAYHFGIFPWYNEEDPILWWHTHPRCVLFPNEIKVSKSMRSFLRKTPFQCSINKSFSEVIHACSSVRDDKRKGTWIHPEIIHAFEIMHQKGFAHSIEVWNDGNLVGGLYGIALGKIFFGESMFSKASNTSKMALIFLAETLKKQNFELIDCQQSTEHLLSMGAIEIPREEFQSHLGKNRMYSIQFDELTYFSK